MKALPTLIDDALTRLQFGQWRSTGQSPQADGLALRDYIATNLPIGMRVPDDVNAALNRLVHQTNQLQRYDELQLQDRNRVEEFLKVIS